MAKTKSTITEVVGVIVEALNPLESIERHRVIQAALVLLGEAEMTTTPNRIDASGIEENYFNEADRQGGKGLSRQAKTWMKQNNISREQLEQIFHIEDEGAEVIAAVMPGKNRPAQTINAYVLEGINSMLINGEANFDDKAARELCNKSGCYDNTNHSRYLAGKGNLFTGTKEKGWKLTNPGLKHGAQLILELGKTQ